MAVNSPVNKKLNLDFDTDIFENNKNNNMKILDNFGDFNVEEDDLD